MTNILEQAKAQARAAQETKTCCLCKAKIFCTVRQGWEEWVDSEPTGTPGEVYSQAGIAEYGISGCCETCFDEALAEPEEALLDTLQNFCEAVDTTNEQE